MRSTPTYPDATDGNVVQTARVALDGDGKTVLALGFGAIAGARPSGRPEGSLAAEFDKTLGSLREGLEDVRRDADQAAEEARRALKTKPTDELERRPTT